MKNVAHRILQFPVAIVMVAYYALTAIVWPIVRPNARAGQAEDIAGAARCDRTARPLSKPRLLAVLVIIIEPLKIGSLAILASGQVAFGTLAPVISYGLSLILIERMFAVVKPKLLPLRWFSVVWGWIAALRDRILAWLHLRAWSIAIRARDAARHNCAASVFLN